MEPMVDGKISVIAPKPLLDRLQHYFLTYKAAPGSAPSGDGFIAEAYGCNEAHEVIRRSQEDYREQFPALCRSFEQWQKGAVDGQLGETPDSERHSR
jgi:hypothetical protein